MSYVDSSASWRFPLLFSIVLASIVMAFIFTLPESPRWLIKVGRIDEAREVLSLTYDLDPNSDRINTEISEVQLSLELSGKASLASMFRMGRQRTFHRVCLAAASQMFLQMSGINSISYYAPSLYEEQLGFTSTVAGILAASSQFVIVLGSIVCSYTVDRFGRRRLMLISATSMSICFACLAGTVSNPDNKSALKAGAFFAFLYFLVYTLGFLGIPFLYASEIAPAHLRAAVCGLSTAVSWLFNFLVAEITPVAFTDIGYKYFIVYCAINAAIVPAVYFFFPETAGRSLEELDEIFASSKTIFDPVSVAKKLPRRGLMEYLREEGKIENGYATTGEHKEHEADEIVDEKKSE